MLRNAIAGLVLLVTGVVLGVLWVTHEQDDDQEDFAPWDYDAH